MAQLRGQRQVHLDLTDGAGIGDTYGFSVSFGAILTLEYGVEVDSSGADAYVDFAYDVGAEATFSLGAVNYTRRVHADEGDKKFTTPRLKW